MGQISLDMTRLLVLVVGSRHKLFFLYHDPTGHC